MSHSVPGMDIHDLTANLEFWSGRRHSETADSGDGPARLPRSFRRRSFRGPAFSFPRLHLPALPARFTRPGGGPGRDPANPRGRARPIAAAALLAALTAGWLVVGHRSHASAAADAAPTSTVPTRPTTPPTSSVPKTTPPTRSPTTIPRTADCHGLAVARPEVRCVVAGVDLDVRRFAPATVAAADVRATGAEAKPRTGPPACAAGHADERSWSISSAPDAAVGRYRCRFESGRAAMWWTQDGRLFHATTHDGDLAALFAWWRAHPSE